MADSNGIPLNDPVMSDEGDVEPLLTPAPGQKRWRVALLVGTVVSAVLGLVCFFAVPSNLTKPAESEVTDVISEALPVVFDDLTENLSVKYGEKWLHKLDFYVPNGTEPPEGGFELVLMLHGMSGTKESMDWWGDKLAGTDNALHADRAVASLNWIQKNGHDVQDILRVVQFFSDKKDEFRINPDKIVLYGFSGGAALTLELALNSDVAEKIAGAIIVSGISKGSEQFCNADSTKKMMIFHSDEDAFLEYSNVPIFLKKCSKFTEITFKRYHGNVHCPIKETGPPSFWDLCDQYLEAIQAVKVPTSEEGYEEFEKEEVKEEGSYKIKYLDDPPPFDENFNMVPYE